MKDSEKRIKYLQDMQAKFGLKSYNQMIYIKIFTERRKFELYGK